ncbi:MULTISPECIES: hypothetical protein [unclassified Desulfovibrio]|uniref:hypothetical protein n=1 Tax=unclassified Desulfovibrio TaxID=2593640 RepID=UPI000F5F148F|nr:MULTISPECIES: hypothetical protein [unclassified Desulfovibrio]RRD70104.1 hypothetical protein EII24_07855 [Desulfovibrio sp. OH1209_COT-279]RRD86648.1 hypothetical protein EII23_07855 [Desulfovibrio sp. OH1186_COT-070]
MNALQIRLKNCIQTILELEPEEISHDGRRHFAPEMRALEGYLAQVERMALHEDDVRRMESATDTFLAELRVVRKENVCPKRLLQ